MAVRAVSKAEFHEIMAAKKDPFPERHVEQMAWFAAGDDKYLGVVLRDKGDKSWCFCVLRKSPDGKYKNVFADLQIKDEKDGIAKLTKDLEKRDAGKIKKKKST